MSKKIYTEGDEGVQLIVKTKKDKRKQKSAIPQRELLAPVHVVYGGADRFSAGTPKKLGTFALKTLADHAPNFVEFARAMDLSGSEELPKESDAIDKLEKRISRNKSKARSENYSAWFAWSVYQKTVAKLESEPVEDYRIDFEDGYGFRTDEEEDADAVRAANELARSQKKGTITRYCGFRIKSFSPETYGRAIRTLELFLAALSDKCEERLPLNFVVTLPKITDRRQVRDLARRLNKFEKRSGLREGSVGIEIMIETPEAIFTGKGNSALQRLVSAGKGRVRSAHFGAFDYTASLGVSAEHQHLRHPACNFARQMMLVNLSPLGVRLVDSVTTQLPITIHRSGNLTDVEKSENRSSIHAGWAEHFTNVLESMECGFYESWDLHPNQLPARFAAVFEFYLTALDKNAQRLRAFIDSSTQATLTGNTFDDAASAQGLLNFFVQGIECGALSEKEATAATSLSPAELRSTFQEIAAARSRR
jgi:citrate lyase beta subunit